MSWGLTIGAYNVLSSGWEDITGIVSGLRIRCVLHGGVQSVEFTINDDYVDAYRWAYDHIGADIYVFDNSCNPPVAQGVILESGISQQGTKVVASGPFYTYCFRQVYNDTSSWIGSGDTDAQIKDMLTDDCPLVNSNQDNIDATGTANWPWQPTDNSYPGDLIPGLVALSDSTNAEWYFWLASAPLNGTAPNEPIPWLRKATLIPGLFQCWREDMAPGGLNLAPSLRDLANDARVMYRDAVGIQNQTASAQDADSVARWWTREVWDYDLTQAPATAAAQYNDLLLARFKDYQQSASFKLNTWAYDEYGTKWPLWRVIADFPVKFAVNDLIPDNTILDFTLDNKRTFITLAAEYDYDTNTLSIVPDTEDNRADALLARHRSLR